MVDGEAEMNRNEPQCTALHCTAINPRLADKKTRPRRAPGRLRVERVRLRRGDDAP